MKFSVPHTYEIDGKKYDIIIKKMKKKHVAKLEEMAQAKMEKFPEVLKAENELEELIAQIVELDSIIETAQPEEITALKKERRDLNAKLRAKNKEYEPLQNKVKAEIQKDNEAMFRKQLEYIVDGKDAKEFIEASGEYGYAEIAQDIVRIFEEETRPNPKESEDTSDKE